jgi:hypothetical protein
MDDLTPQARAAAEQYTRAAAAHRRAAERLAELAPPLEPVDGRPPSWTPEQHGAVVDYHKAVQQLVLAMSAWIAAPKT